MSDKSIIAHNITCWPEFGLNYWGINKNATSTITMHFGQLAGDIHYTDSDIAEGVAWKLPEQNHFRYITPTQALTNNNRNFCVIRDPYSRFISCYNHLANPQHEVQLNTQRKTRFDIDWTPNDFMEHIAETLHKGKKINKHWRPQIDFVKDLKRFAVVVRMEEFDESWKMQLDVPAPQIISNPSAHYHLEFDHQRLYEIYKCDFEALGYESKISRNKQSPLFSPTAD